MTWLDDPRRRGSAAFRGVRAARPVEHVDASVDGHRLSSGGFWVVVATFEGRLDAWRMAEVERAPAAGEDAADSREWHGPDASAWRSSLSRDEYLRGVEAVRRDIFEGEVYQANLCRVLSAPLPAPPPGPDAVALSHVLATGNPARHAARIVIPGAAPWPGCWVVSASPELYLRVDGGTIASSPIKGTTTPGAPMLDKDVAENVMITDLIRNDLSHVAVPGSVAVPELLGRHEHPGLAHLQSTVTATLAPAYDWTSDLWPALLAGTFPPGSVSGAPKSSALRIIAREETAARGPYCGAIGWIDADNRQAELAVGIRTFWWDEGAGGTLHFGTGAGITWGSDPAGEWAETELKARRLIGLASADTMAT
ncbi:chorismate-binding protein [Demequina sp. TTPB684]|uniref:chorismate-binding protein n=1 Tax=unclassified Demequina TaxID=2620311 RepID=UPI001CF4C0E4|nr:MULTISPECIES: chorismate-binding protein [unclassified Demequina]MCB2414092.1 chorismate-binding protein [Demequina sp. TTPB684]UPU89197.1 chorismate-binding protein [Demequina sp. TMPB413]